MAAIFRIGLLCIKIYFNYFSYSENVAHPHRLRCAVLLLFVLLKFSLQYRSRRPPPRPDYRSQDVYRSTSDGYRGHRDSRRDNYYDYYSYGRYPAPSRYSPYGSSYGSSYSYSYTSSRARSRSPPRYRYSRQRAYIWNIRLYYPYRQYTNLFIFRFVSEDTVPMQHTTFIVPLVGKFPAKNYTVMALF